MRRETKNVKAHTFPLTFGKVVLGEGLGIKGIGEYVQKSIEILFSISIMMNDIK